MTLRPPLAAAELRRVLSQKRSDTFLRILRCAPIHHRFVLEFHLLVERIGGRAVEQTLHSSVSARGAVGQPISYRFRLCDQLIIRDYPVTRPISSASRAVKVRFVNASSIVRRSPMIRGK